MSKKRLKLVASLLAALPLLAAVLIYPDFGWCQTSPKTRAIPTNKLNETASSVEERAVAAIGQSSFDSLLERRAAKLDFEARRFYEQELRRRPEMKDVKILADDDARVLSFNRNINPILHLFDRDDYTKPIVFESNNPFVGLYRECLLLVSTKALELLSQEEQRAAAAHELAHEIFIDEMRAADKTNDNGRRQLIELECDLAAVMATSQLKDNPFAVASADAKFARWYGQNPPADALDLEPEKSPTNFAREQAIKLFLAARNSQSSKMPKTPQAFKN